MELDQRVKALEYEMKILKNEIQRTLLDIQEQILVHYYPALRSEETKPSDGLMQTIEQLRAKQVGSPTGSSAPVASAPLPVPSTPVTPPSPMTPAPVTSPAIDAGAVKKVVDWAKQPSQETDAPQPLARKVSLDEIRTQTEKIAAPTPTNIHANLPKLLEWVMNNGVKIGGPRTVKIVDVYGRKGFLPADIKGTLMSVAALNKEAPEKVASTDVLNGLLELDKLVGRPGNPDDALSFMEEANLG
jgi:hypothetical protein